jgi:hypothetical protein
LRSRFSAALVEAAVAVSIAEVEDGADDLPAPKWICPTVSTELEHDHRAVIGVDGRTKVRLKRTRGGSALRVVHPAETTPDQALTPPFGKVQALLPTTLQADHPTLGIGEPNPVQLF